MNFKRRLASKNLEANLTSGVATGWKKAKKPFLVSRFCGSKQKNESGLNYGRTLFVNIIHVLLFLQKKSNKNIT
jgi:hypothetical protein